MSGIYRIGFEAASNSRGYSDMTELQNNEPHWLEKQIDTTFDQMTQGKINETQAVRILKSIKELSLAIMDTPSEKELFTRVLTKLDDSKFRQLFDKFKPNSQPEQQAPIGSFGAIGVNFDKNVVVRDRDSSVVKKIEEECKKLWIAVDARGKLNYNLPEEERYTDAVYFYGKFLLESYPKLSPGLSFEKLFKDIVCNLHPENKNKLTPGILLRFGNYFGPFAAEDRPHILERMNALICVPGFVGSVPKNQKQKLFENAPIGSYIIRFSDSKKDCLVLETLTMKNGEKVISQELISLKNGILKRLAGTIPEMPIENAQGFFRQLLQLHKDQPAIALVSRSHYSEIQKSQVISYVYPNGIQGI